MFIILEHRHRLLHWRAYLAKKESAVNRKFVKYTMDLLSIPEYVIKKGRPHGHRYGKKPGNKEHHLANQLKKKCRKKKFQGIHDRFLRDHEFRVRMIEHNRDEEVCRRWDVLADEDHTYHLSEEEYFSYKDKLWLHSKKSGSDTLPLRKRSDFKQALSTLNLYTKKLEDNNSGPYPTGSTRNGDRHRVLPPPGGNGENPGGLPKNSKKVKKEEASKGLRSNGATRCLQYFSENL